VVEFVNQAEAKNLRNNIYNFFGVSESERDDNYQLEICTVKDDSFNKYRERDIRAIRSLERRGLKTEDELNRFEISVKDETIDSLGLFESMGDRGVILIKESMADEHVKIHETIHSMTGFGLARLGDGKNLNEAATEVLTLAYLHKTLDVWDLYPKVTYGEMDARGYQNIAGKLLAIMAYAKENGQFEIKDLAKYYFNDKQYEKNLREEMIKEIIPKMPETFRLRDNAEKCLNSDLKEMV
jgi:hypothetical protein